MMGNGKEEIPGKWWGWGRGVMKANANIKELIHTRDFMCLFRLVREKEVSEISSWLHT